MNPYLYYDMVPVAFAGNVSKILPTLRHTSKGVPVTNLMLARHMGKDRDGHSNPPEWYDVAVYGDMAIRIVNSVATGDRILVIGNFRQKSRQDSGKIINSVDAIDIGFSLMWSDPFDDTLDETLDGEHLETSAPETENQRRDITTNTP